jgi:HPt (histidine-containing phosphotransfer) domain-containing protein
MNHHQPAPAARQSPLYQSALDNIRALQQPGQPDLLTKIIDTYLDTARDLVDALCRSLCDGDIEVLGRSAHTLKSSAASLGAMRVSDLCRQLEDDVRAGHLDSAARLIADIQREHESSSAALRRERAKTAGASALTTGA